MSQIQEMYFFILVVKKHLERKNLFFISGDFLLRSVFSLFGWKPERFGTTDFISLIPVGAFKICQDSY